MGFLKKLRHAYIWERIFYERLTEPLHLNVLSAFVAAFGSFRLKVKYDLVLRPNNAFGILKAASGAREAGIDTVTLIEFGVASGAGLINMARIAARVTQETGVRFKLYGFDTGTGMPPPRDYRDHPDLYHEGGFASDFERLSRNLPSNARLVLGNVAETVPAFLAQLPPTEPIGYVALDVDYYSSAKDALEIFTGRAEQYLPLTPVYLDDIWCERHNSACGERLAVSEFSAGHPLRLIEYHPFFEHSRIFRRARWVRQMYFMHVLDHASRTEERRPGEVAQLENVFL